MKLFSSQIRYRIVRKMIRHKYWGGKHTSIQNIPKGFPPELKKDILKEVKEQIDFEKTLEEKS